MRPAFYEFFAGGGMARLGLGPDWTCLFANEIASKKAAYYRRNFGDGGELCVADICTLDAGDLPGNADLAWASFPCQDLSLAGTGAGLKGARSGTFWAFLGLIEKLAASGRIVPVLAIENVVGLLTSHGGADFTTLVQGLMKANYRTGAIVIDAADFLPQSRPRLFIVAVHKDLQIPAKLLSPLPDNHYHSSSLLRAFQRLPKAASEDWLWWHLPIPPRSTASVRDILEESVEIWHTREETDRLVSQMSAATLEKLRQARKRANPAIGLLYRRTRLNEKGAKVVRAEARFDGLSGCLRTPAGGSSRQVLLVATPRMIRSRLLTPRETARLMGIPDSYDVPENYNEAYHLMGDGIVVPVVNHLANSIIFPLLQTADVTADVA